jgi:hypothetical protein
MMSQKPDTGVESAQISLSAVYRQLDDHLEQDEAPYDVAAGLHRLTSWMSAERSSTNVAPRQKAVLDPLGQAAPTGTSQMEHQLARQGQVERQLHTRRSVSLTALCAVMLISILTGAGLLFGLSHVPAHVVLPVVVTIGAIDAVTILGMAYLHRTTMRALQDDLQPSGQQESQSVAPHQGKVLVETPASGQSPIDTPAPQLPRMPLRPRRQDPFEMRRNSRVGDVVHLPDGDFVLLTRLTREDSCPADVFIGVEVPKPGQARPNARNRNPVRAVKLTKLDETGRVIPMSDAEVALFDNFPVDSSLLEPRSLTENRDGRIAYTMDYHPRNDLERYVYADGPDRPRLTSSQAVEVGLTLVRGLQKLWDMGLIHNDARLRNILFTGPLVDGDRLSMLVPGQNDRAVLTDYNFIGRVGGTYHDPPGLVVNALEGDPALVRWMLAHCDDDGLPSPLGLASDCYAPFAVVYALLSGGLSPTAALLLDHGWNREALQQFDSPDSVQTWRDLLGDPPGLLQENPPSLLDFGVPRPLALAVDAGVRADPILRQPRIAGAGDISPAAACGYVEDELSHARDASSHRWLRQPIPKIHDAHPWRGFIEPPVGFPTEVIEYLSAQWPASVQGGAS